MRYGSVIRELHSSRTGVWQLPYDNTSRMALPYPNIKRPYKTISSRVGGILLPYNNSSRMTLPYPNIKRPYETISSRTGGILLPYATAPVSSSRIQTFSSRTKRTSSRITFPYETSPV